MQAFIVAISDNNGERGWNSMLLSFRKRNGDFVTLFDASNIYFERKATGRKFSVVQKMQVAFTEAESFFAHVEMREFRKCESLWCFAKI